MTAPAKRLNIHISDGYVGSEIYKTMYLNTVVDHQDLNAER